RAHRLVSKFLLSFPYTLTPSTIRRIVAVPSKRDPAKGLTLLEIVVTMGLIGLAAVLVGFGFRDLYPSLHLQGAVKDIVLDIQTARMMAIAQNRSCRIVFSPAQEAYQLEKSSASGGGQWTGTPAGIRREFNNPNNPYHHPGVDLVGSTFNPVFSPRGTAAGASILLIGGGRQKVITISSQGSVKVK
ncbi:MAG TPA: GspH/FimT family pseudopilin, partial [Thermodesulfobacteriota bacterium]|nr:GspH/FimT family pseudopilin [Thermodesulfobacteriota bacterium]